MDVAQQNVTLDGWSSKELTVAEDELVESWLLMKSPLPIVGLVTFYLAFVLFIGPKIMARRRPYNLKQIMIAYNLLQVIYNAYIVNKLFSTEGAVTYIVNHYCFPLDSQVNPLRIVLCGGMWHYAVLKLLDLLDTVFFVLRKKQSHVTFLHLYHHSAMVLLSWSALKYVRGEQATILGVLNSLVHVVMYSYYFLAALGEKLRPYLWWKRYITTIQIAQFVIMIVYLSSLVILNCNLPRGLSYLWFSQAGVFLSLFVNFYIKAYGKKDSVQKEKSL